MIVLGYSGYTRDLRVPGTTGSPLAKAALTFDNLFRFREGEAPLRLFPLGFFGHDGAAALIRDGDVVACAAEERFTRVKHGLNLAGNTMLPRRAVAFCLQRAGLDLEDVDVVAHYCDFTPARVRERLDLLRPYVDEDTTSRLRRAYASVYDAMLSPESVLHQFERMTGRVPRRLVPVPHHRAHAASAFFASGMEESLILTLDSSGEVESSMLAVGRDSKIQELETTRLPTSLGTLYLLLTVYLGFRSLGDEFKVMGLASYGDPRPYRLFFASLIEKRDAGRYAMPALARPNLREAILESLGPVRAPGDPVQRRHMDIAASLQECVETAVLDLLEEAQVETGQTRLCMAGGVALNCTLNAAIARSRRFQDIFVQPAASDEGGSVGAALSAYYEAHPDAPVGPRWRHTSFGPEFDDDEIETALRRHDAALRWRRVEDVATATAEAVAGGAVVGWFQGRMEFGPRALGNRSILADPRDARNKDRVNRLVKRREEFRPFAPAVLEEEAPRWFDLCGLADSPFMLFAFPVRAPGRRGCPAVTHIDGTGRVQTVARADHPRFWALIHHFASLTGVPVVLNTSFNVRGEPIVCTPDDAIRCFLSTGIDLLGIGSFLVEKREAA